MKLGFIGVGNMGEAILRGALRGGVVQAEDVLAFDVSREKLERLGDELRIVTCASAAELIAGSDIVLLAVKPHICPAVLAENGDALCGKALISIAAGWSQQRLEAALPPSVRVLRVMPNTPALVGAGMTAICRQTTLSAADLAYAQGIFDAIGETAVIDEKLFDGFIAVSGSSPAYIFMLIEAMADAAVREGIRRPDAVKMAAQAVIGSAKMVLETGKHPGQLKDEVCSPAGTTIEAVEMLEKRGFRAAVQDAMAVCAEKSRQMSK